MSRNRTVGLFMNVGHTLDHMLMLVFPTAVLGMGADFGRSFGELLVLSTGGFLAFGLGSVPAGWLGDLWSRRNMMALYFIGIGLATVLTGFSASPLTLALGLTLMGTFASIYHPVGTAMLLAHSEKIGKALGINGVCGNLGVAVAALATGALTQWLGWRWAFFVPGAIAFALGLAFLALVPDTGNAKSAGTARKLGGELPRGIVVRAFVVLALTSAASSTVFNASSVAMPKVFAERLAELTGSPLGVGLLVSLVYGLGAIAQLVVGRMLDRHPLRTAFVRVSVLQAPCLLLAAFAHGALLVPLAIGVMFAVFGQVTINDAMVARYTSEAWRSRVYAVRYLVSFGAAASAVPLVAFLHDRAGGFERVFEVLAIFGLIVFASALFFPLRPDEVAPRRVAAGVAGEGVR